MERSLARNHHFISQAEQRLNAIDNSIKPENQRIYKFDILEREQPSIRKINSNGVKIEKNLSRLNLYALQTLKGGGQHNLESAFQKYENDTPKITKTLLEKLHNPKPISFENELLRLYALKLLNTIRNPYAIKRTLEMFSELHGVLPADQVLQPHFISLDGGNRPQVERICSEFEVTKEEYVSWLKVMYLLILQPLDHGLNLIEHLIKNLLNNNNVIKNFSIFQYNKEFESAGVLLSDRMIDQRPRKGTQIQMFNLDASTFMIAMLIDIKTQDIVELPPEASESNFKQSNVVHIDYKVNDLKMLKKYNQHCVWLAHSSVYCANEKPFGVACEIHDAESSKN